MKRNTLLFVVAALVLLLMMALLLTGLLIKYVLPPGSGGRGGGAALVVWGMTRHDWGAVHWWIAATLFLVALVHLFLHWSWVVTLPNRWLHAQRSDSAPPSKGVRRLAAAGFLLVMAALIAGWLAFANSQVVERPRVERGRGHIRLRETAPQSSRTQVENDAERGEADRTGPKGEGRRRRGAGRER